MRAIPFLLAVFLFLSGASPLLGRSEVPSPAQFSYKIVHEYPHDPNAFTQGLVWDEGTMYEGTGLHGRSSLRRVDLLSGRVEQQRNYERQYFAEGITVFRNTIYQLTWKNSRVFLYAKKDFSLLGSRSYPRQGWGITHNGRQLIASDGTAHLYFLDPATLVEQRRILVQDDQGPVNRLNELEYVRGSVYANVWHTDRIAIIDPETGVVSGQLDLTGLSARAGEKKKIDVLNGIMYDAVHDRLFVTGKLWPSLFEIRVIPAAE
ncbi:MAG: glutaminyl-peptide cyclotransferase [Candidatus Electrothrix sp. YB6]